MPCPSAPQNPQQVDEDEEVANAVPIAGCSARRWRWFPSVTKASWTAAWSKLSLRSSDETKLLYSSGRAQIKDNGGKFIIQHFNGKAGGTQIANGVKSRVHSVDEGLQRLILNFPDGKEVVIGIKTRSCTLLHVYSAEGSPHLHRIVLDAIKVHPLTLFNH